MTGGTICMRQSEDGLIPSRNFLQSGMEPRPSFNDATNPSDLVVVLDDGTEKPHRSLRTPVSRYRKHVRYAVLEFEKLLDSSSVNGTWLWHLLLRIFVTGRQHHTDMLVMEYYENRECITNLVSQYRQWMEPYSVHNTPKLHPFRRVRSPSRDRLAGIHFFLPQLHVTKPREASHIDRFAGSYVRVAK